VVLCIPKDSVTTASVEFKLDRAKLRQVRQMRPREGRYLLRTNLGAHDPAQLWKFYIQLSEVEQALKELKHDLAVRPIFHQSVERIETHIFVALLAWCLQVTLKARLRPHCCGHHAARGAGQVQDHADGRCTHHHHRRTRTDLAALHAARGRTPHVAGAVAPDIAGTTAAKHYGKRGPHSCASDRAVVKTCDIALDQINGLPEIRALS